MFYFRPFRCSPNVLFQTLSLRFLCFISDPFFAALMFYFRPFLCGSNVLFQTPRCGSYVFISDPGVRVATVDVQASIQNIQYTEALNDVDSPEYRNLTTQFCSEVCTILLTCSLLMTIANRWQMNCNVRKLTI